jgi:hypothetical protein
MGRLHLKLRNHKAGNLPPASDAVSFCIAVRPEPVARESTGSHSRLFPNVLSTVHSFDKLRLHGVGPPQYHWGQMPLGEIFNVARLHRRGLPQNLRQILRPHGLHQILHRRGLHQNLHRPPYEARQMTGGRLLRAR